MDRSELHRHILSTLQRYGVSPCEEAVLGIVYYGINLPPLGVAEWAKCYDDNDGNPFGVYPLDEYRRAVDGCIEKGWLTVLTPEHFEREHRRLRLSAIPEVVDRCHNPGEVDYTEVGFAFHRLLLREMNGPEFLEQECFGCNRDEGRRVIDVYATSEEMCLHGVEEVRGNAADFVGGPVRVTGVEGPRPIGPWKPCRFLTLPSGFHAAVQVALLNEEEPRPS